MKRITRRQACTLVGITPFIALSAVSRAEAEEATAAALAAAEEQYAAVQAQIDSLAAEQESLSIELSATLDALDAKQAEIDATQAQINTLEEQIAQLEAEIAQLEEQIAQAQAELEAAQDDLADYMVSAYKYGTTTTLEVLFDSRSFEELAQNAYYLTKISDSEAELIDSIRDIKQQLEDDQARLEADEASLEEQKAELEWQRSSLEGQYAELDGLRGQQEYQMSEIQNRQSEAYALLNSLDSEVQALTEQYNQELIEIARAEEEARQRAAEEAAAAEAAAAAQANGYSSGGSGTSYGGSSASAVVNACYSTPSPGSGYCALWVSYVFINAGIGAYYGNACEMYSRWCTSSNRGNLQTGMIVAVSTHTNTSAGRLYGHVGIYIGGNQVMDNVGYIRTSDLDSWLAYYSTTVTPRWGWLGGVYLS